MHRHWAAVAVAAWGVATATPARSAMPEDYADLTLEQLLKIEITSAAKRPESIENTPAAVFVLTNEDIRRMGARSIPEALRMVPGLNVAQITASSWSISSRGFNGRFANKLLVLIDGRTVYTPLFSGVYWDRQDTLLEDVERIEVIRGPGAALWGANAVNGVINVITKHARDTRGGFLSAGAGSNDEIRGEGRYGGSLGENGHYRVYGKAFSEGSRAGNDGVGGADDWRSARAGFRVDLSEPGGDTWHVQGGSFSSVVGDGYVGPTLTAPYSERLEVDGEVAGHFVLGSWSRELSAGNQVEMRMYYQRDALVDPRVEEERDTVDVEALHRFAVGDRHRIVWGAGGRYSRDNLSESFAVDFEPDSDDLYLINAFAQDTLQFFGGDVEVTAGTKVEYNSYTGLEIQPSVRGIWHLDDRNSTWAAVSRAVRTPSRAENDLDIAAIVIPPTAGGLPSVVRFIGDPSVTSEDLLSLEAGYRWQADRNLSFDVAAFYNFYDRLVSSTAGTPFAASSDGTSYVVVPLDTANDDEADVYGLEVVGNWRPAESLRLQGWYAFLQTDYAQSADSNHQVAARSLWDVTPTVTLDATARYVSEIDVNDTDAYVELGVRLAWRPVPNLELAITGQNLLHSERLELNGDAVAGTISTKAERSVFGSVSLKF
ncbi:TonB-dependent receptor plug domain-containing protein [Thalassobaculum sp.]|uniref:TonB-dependent receptor plug domain-containing protein n=1 Tax=Thalassobaculum sp. TaxID=2022740 RepID=UPI0032EC15FD